MRVFRCHAFFCLLSFFFSRLYEDSRCYFLYENAIQSVSKMYSCVCLGFRSASAGLDQMTLELENLPL